jgi:Na+-translocating ferredoxin:NAD+ oxidoreductase RnfG subunit
MSKKAHFNPKSLTWLISLVVMIIVCVGVIFGSQALNNFANRKYDQSVEIDFTIASTEEVDLASLNAEQYNVTSLQKAYDSAGELVAYIVEGTTVGYNAEVPIETSTIISADGEIVCGIDILHQEETEYLGVRIQTAEFTDQFTGRYLPVVASGSSSKGSNIDTLAKSTISSQAVIDAVNNAQSFVLDNFGE